jgi:hypothetical protein
LSLVYSRWYSGLFHLWNLPSWYYWNI